MKEITVAIRTGYKADEYDDLVQPLGAVTAALYGRHGRRTKNYRQRWITQFAYVP
jgi:hypothetical protein